MRANGAASLSNRDAEEALLGSMILDGECVKDVLQLVKEHDFSLAEHRRVFCGLRKLHELSLPIDLVTLDDELRRGRDAGGIDPLRLVALTERVPSSASVSYYAEIVRENSDRRRLANALSSSLEMVKSAAARSDELAADAVHRLEEVLRARCAGLSDLDRSAAALIRAELPRPRNIVGDGLLVEGTIGVLGARPGLGKTWAVLQLGIAVPQGRAWLGISTEPTRVGVVSLELTEFHLQERLRTLAGEEVDNLEELWVIGRGRALDLQNSSCVHHLSRWIERRGLGLVIIDPVSRAHGADENDAREMGLILGNVERVCHETGAAILIVHHERKGDSRSKGGNDMDSFRGSSLLQSGANLMVRLVPERGAFQLRFCKANYGVLPDPIWVERDERGAFLVRGAPPAKADIGARNRARISDAIRSGPKTRAELEELTGLKKSAVLSHLSALRATRNSEGRFVHAGKPRGES